MEATRRDRRAAEGGAVLDPRHRVQIELLPASGGRFEVTLDGELLFSKAALGRHAKKGEIAALVRDRVGPEVTQG
jgi:predicted Rdx family selenoprotein